MEMEAEVAVTAGELSLQPDVVDDVELPQSEAEFHTDSDDHFGDDSDEHSDDHSDNDSDYNGQLVSHLYPFMCQIDHRVSQIGRASCRERV